MHTAYNVYMQDLYIQYVRALSHTPNMIKNTFFAAFRSIFSCSAWDSVASKEERRSVARAQRRGAEGAHTKCGSRLNLKCGSPMWGFRTPGHPQLRGMPASRRCKNPTRQSHPGGRKKSCPKAGGPVHSHHLLVELLEPAVSPPR